MADKFEGKVHNPPMRGLTLAVKEPLGVMAAILNDNLPLLSLSTILFLQFCLKKSYIP